MTALNKLATRLRLNAASMEHGEAEADIRAAFWREAKRRMAQ